MGLKIIHVVLGKANPNRPNGVNKVVNSLATNQSEIGFDVAVWGITKIISRNYPDRNYKTVLFRDVFKFFLDSKIKKEMKNLDKNTVFHIHGAFIPQFFLMARRIRKMGFSYVYTSHGAYNEVALKRSKWKKRLYSALFEKNLVKHAKCVQALANSELDWIVHLNYTVPYEIIPNGQGLEELKHSFSPVEKKGKTVFGFVGRIDIQTKGLDILIKGFAKHIERSSTDVVLWIIGDGKELKRLKLLASTLNIENHIEFLGARYGKEKLNLIANMDFLCLTSRNEGMPGVVLEASGLGVPCIVSQETNMADYLRKNKAGMSLLENTPNHLAQVLLEACVIKESKKFMELKLNAVKMVKNRFDWKEISWRLINIYEA